MSRPKSSTARVAKAQRDARVARDAKVSRYMPTITAEPVGPLYPFERTVVIRARQGLVIRNFRSKREITDGELMDILISEGVDTFDGKVMDIVDTPPTEEVL